jgi:hypothetical protein
MGGEDVPLAAWDRANGLQILQGSLRGQGVDVENYPGVVGAHATGRGVVELMRSQVSTVL